MVAKNNNFVNFFIFLIFQQFFCERNQENLVKKFQKTVGFFRNNQENKDGLDSMDYFLEEIEKYRKDKIKQEKIGEIYQSFEKKREDLLHNLELRDQKICETKLNQSLDMVPNI